MKNIAALAEMIIDDTLFQVASRGSKLFLLADGIELFPLRGSKRLAGGEITGNRARDRAAYAELSRQVCQARAGLAA